MCSFLINHAQVRKSDGKNAPFPKNPLWFTPSHLNPLIVPKAKRETIVRWLQLTFLQEEEA